MNFFHSTETLRSCRRYELAIHFTISVKAENRDNATDQSDTEENNVGINWVTPEVVEERVRANLEPQKDQNVLWKKYYLQQILIIFPELRFFWFTWKKTLDSGENIVFMNYPLIRFLPQIFHRNRFWKNSSLFRENPSFFVQKSFNFCTFCEIILFQSHSTANIQWFGEGKVFTVRASDTFTHIGHWQNVGKKRSFSAFSVDNFPSTLKIWFYWEKYFI